MAGYAADAAPAAAPDAPAASKKEKGGKAKANAPPVPSGPPPAEKSAEELAKMSKEERTQYHMARRAAQQSGSAATGEAAKTDGKANASGQLTKAQRRALQEAQRKVKEDKANASKEGDEQFEELKLQGLTEDQAREVLNAMKSGEPIAEEEDDDDEDADDLLGSVRMWMNEQPDGEIPEDAIRDFNMKVRFQGHVDTTPPDHLGAVLQVLVEQACSTCDLTAPKIQPGAIAKVLGPLATRWANMLRSLYRKTAELNVLEAIQVVVQTISEVVVTTGAPAQGQDCAVVGCLMAIREIDDLVEDEDLLVGCKKVEPRSHVLDKFIEFLEDALAEDDEDDDDDED